MDLQRKIQILGESARYDASCASSGSGRGARGGMGAAMMPGICHSWSDDGRCISLLKILYSNECVYNCAYCVNSCTNDVPRTTFTPEELANLTIEFYRRNYIEGLFLSSGVVGSPDATMEQLLRTAQLLRKEHRFGGYIHAKAIPGSSPELIAKLGRLVDRMSVNIELPSEASLQKFAPCKTKNAILKPMGIIAEGIRQTEEAGRTFHRPPLFVPAGQSTQLIVGASDDSDLRILRLAEGLYRKYTLKRVYYSAYIPVGVDPRLPALNTPPLLREHRSYQADWLLRRYGFRAEEVLDEAHPAFEPDVDPKAAWALRNLHLFPVDVNKAPYEMLLRVPGVGVTSAKRIVEARRVRRLDPEALKKLGVVMKRAQFFLLCDGKTCAPSIYDPTLLRARLTDDAPRAFGQQLTLFDAA